MTDSWMTYDKVPVSIHIMASILDHLKFLPFLFFKAEHQKNVEKLKILICFPLIFFKVFERQLWLEGLVHMIFILWQ